MELRYETLTIPAPQRTHAGVNPVKLSVVHAREISSPPQGKRLEWFPLTILPVTDPEQARRLLTWYGLRWRVEDYKCNRHYPFGREHALKATILRDHHALG